jgi:hypothetical protein
MVDHPKWAAMEVGEICCDKLTCTEVASGHMSELRRRAERIKRFVSSPKWRGELSSSSYIHNYNARIGVILAGSSYRIEVNDRCGKLEFSSPIDARVKVFELLEDGKLGAYVRKRRLQAMASN